VATDRRLGQGGSPLCFSVYALANPRPDHPLRSIVFQASSDLRVAVLGITLYSGPGHPLRHVPRRAYRLTLPASEKALASDVHAELDMGVVTRLYAAPAPVDEAWLKAEDRGLGAPPPAPEPGREFLLEATGSEGAVLTVKAGDAAHELPSGEAFAAGSARSTDGRARVELLHHRTTWVHVRVIDGSTRG
jgi:hypothetical protein